MSRVDEHVKERGWKCIPLEGNKKTPIAAAKGWPDREEPFVIEDGTNYGIACGGKDGLYVIDTDVPKPGDGTGLLCGVKVMDAIMRHFNDDERWDTPQVQTPTGGEHYYMMCDKSVMPKTGANMITVYRNGHKYKAKIDGRGKNGYVLGPGDIHPVTGTAYEWREDFTPEDRDLMPIPDILMGLLKGTHVLHWDGDNMAVAVSPDTKKIPTKAKETVPAVTLAMLERIVVGLDSKRADDRTDWRNVLWGIQSEVGEDGLDIAIDFSKRSKAKYVGSRDVRKTMEDANGSIKVGSLWHWLKEDNLALFNELQGEQHALMKVEEKPFSLTDEYYLMDFINMLIEKTWDDFGTLQAIFNKHVRRALFRTFGGFDWYVKLNEKERFMALRKLPRDIIYYFKIDPKGQRYRVQVRFMELADALINIVPKYDSVIFHPFAPTEECIEQGRDMNIWPGFKSRLVECVDMAKIQPILDHINIVWASENKIHYDYILAWMKYLVCDPRHKNRVALVFRSKNQQIGKGLIADDFFRKLVVGETIGYYDKGLDFITQKFNEHLMSKVLVVADELTSIEGGGYHAVFDAMKSMITCSSMSIEIKGGKKFQTESYINMILLTNSQFSVKVEAGDQRYFVVDCCERYHLDFAYFKKMLDEHINQETADHFLTYLCQLKTDVNLNDIPASKLKEEMIEQNLSSGERFVNKVRELKTFEEVDPFGIDAEMVRLETEPASVVYEIYKRWCQSVGEKALSQKTFGSTIKNMVEMKRTKKCMVYVF